MGVTDLCGKCKGLFVSDLFLCDDYWINGIRCVNCGNVKLNEKVIIHANQTKDNRVNKLDELQLYRARSRGTKRNSHNI